MKSFQWKRKAKVLTDNEEHSEIFGPAVATDQDDLDPSVDWLTATKRRKVLHLEDGPTKAKRLSDEGTFLADKERWWEAINRFRSALDLEPDNYTARDMMAQCYMQVCEVFQAVKAASQVTAENPRWWPGHQTLGRAYMGIGEVEMAVKSFSRAVHIHPQSKELWSEDLKWAQELLSKHNSLQEECEVEKLKEQAEAFVLMEVTDEFEITDDKDFDQLIGQNFGDVATNSKTSPDSKNPPDSKTSSGCKKPLVSRKPSMANSSLEMPPPITSCSRKGFKRKVACEDARFNKPVASFDQSGHVQLSSRGKVKLDDMVCLRS